MTITLLVGLYVLGTVLLLALFSALDLSIPASLRRAEDAEQMSAIRRRSTVRSDERDPFATAS